MNKNIIIVFLVLIIGVLSYFQFRPGNKIVTPIPLDTKEQTNTPNSLPSPKDPVAKNYSGNNFTVEHLASNVYEDTVTYAVSLGAKAVEFFNVNPNNSSSEGQMLYSVFIKDNINDNKTLDSYSKNLIKHINGEQDFPINEKSFSIADRAGIQYSYKSVAGGYDGTVYVTSVVHDNKAYIILFVDGTYSEYMKFVSSFKFE